MSSTKPTGGPAFPLATHGGSVAKGMDLREYFAAHAPFTMTDAISGLKRSGCPDPTGAQIVEMLAAMRFSYADAMLEARQK